VLDGLRLKGKRDDRRRLGTTDQEGNLCPRGCRPSRRNRQLTRRRRQSAGSARRAKTVTFGSCAPKCASTDTYFSGELGRADARAAWTQEPRQRPVVAPSLLSAAATSPLLTLLAGSRDGVHSGSELRSPRRSPRMPPSTQRRDELTDPLMSPGLVEIVRVLDECLEHMTLAEHEDVVEALAAHSAQEALAESIHLWGSHGCFQNPRTDARGRRGRIHLRTPAHRANALSTRGIVVIAARSSSLVRRAFSRGHGVDASSSRDRARRLPCARCRSRVHGRVEWQSPRESRTRSLRGDPRARKW
jgi:hypothetical protein